MPYRKIMEKQLGRKLTPEEQVHHKDRNHFNNDPANLELCPTAQDHANEHAWSDDELLDWLIQFEHEYGKMPTTEECNLHPGMPHSSTFRRHFGSFKAAKRLAADRNQLIDQQHLGWGQDESYYEELGASLMDQEGSDG